MAGFDFDALEQKLQNINNPMSMDEMDLYLNQLGSLSGDQANKAKVYIERLQAAKRRVAAFDRDLSVFEDKLLNMPPEEFAARDDEIAEKITPEKVKKASGKIEGLSDEENDAIYDFIASEAQLTALQEGKSGLSNRAYNNIIKDAVERTHAGMAQSVAAAYYDNKISFLSKELQKEKDVAKQKRIKNQIRKIEKEQARVPTIVNFEDLKKKGIAFSKDPLGAYIAVKDNINKKKIALVEKFYGKHPKIVAFGKRVDERMTKVLGDWYTKPKEFVNKIGPKTLVNVSGGILCSLIPPVGVGPAVWAGAKTAYVLIEAKAEQRKEKTAAMAEFKKIEEEIVKNQGDATKIQELQKKKEQSIAILNSGFGKYLKQHPETLVKIGVNAFTIGGTAGLFAANIGMVDLSGTLGGVRDTIANSAVVGKLGSLSEKISNLGLKVSGRTIVGAGASVLNGISTSGLELGRAFVDKEHRKEHLKSALKSFGFGFVGAAAAMGINSSMIDKAEAATVAAENNAGAGEGVTDAVTSSDDVSMEQTAITEPYEMDIATHDKIKDLMIRGPKYATAYLREQGLLSEEDLALADGNGGVLLSSRLKEVLESGKINEEQAQALLAEHDRVLTTTGYASPEDQEKWNSYIEEKDSESRTLNNANQDISEEVKSDIISKEDNIIDDSAKDVSDGQYIEPEGPMKPVTTGDHYDTPDGRPPVYMEENQENVADDVHSGPHQTESGSYEIKDMGNGKIRASCGISVNYKDVYSFNQQTGLSLEGQEAQNVVAYEKIYQDLLARQAAGEDLSGAERQFMANHDKLLEEKYGYKREVNNNIGLNGEVKTTTATEENSPKQKEVIPAAEKAMSEAEEKGSSAPQTENKTQSVVDGGGRTISAYDVMKKAKELEPDTYIKNDDGSVVYGGTKGASLYEAQRDEGKALRDIVRNDEVYKDCLEKQANGELNDVQKEFMANHEENLTKHGITHDEKGELRKMTQEEREAVKLNNNQNSSNDSSSQVYAGKGKAIDRSFVSRRASRSYE